MPSQYIYPSCQDKSSPSGELLSLLFRYIGSRRLFYMDAPRIQIIKRVDSISADALIDRAEMIGVLNIAGNGIVGEDP